MVTVSLQPFAFRKIVLLIAALIWLTSAVVFADPVFMHAQATRFARHANRFEVIAAHNRSEVRVAHSSGSQHPDIAPPAEAPEFSVSLELFGSYNVDGYSSTGLNIGDQRDETFWSMPLGR
jgi:hypothetical protein